MNESEIIAKLNESLTNAKSSLKAAERWLEKLAGSNGIPANSITLKAQESVGIQEPESEGKVVEGVFDGQNMLDSKGDIYPVPANYASKSKLVPSDKLKLSIADNGAFIFKQIELVPRKLIIGHLVLEGSEYQVLAEGKSYKVLYASVTFFRAKVGDQVTVIIPEEGPAEWAAIENVLPAKTESVA